MYKFERASFQVLFFESKKLPEDAVTAKRRYNYQMSCYFYKENCFEYREYKK